MLREDSGLAAPLPRGFWLPLLLLLLPLLLLLLLLRRLPLPSCWLSWHLVLVEGIRRMVSISAQCHWPSMAMGEICDRPLTPLSVLTSLSTHFSHPWVFSLSCLELLANRPPR